MAQAAQIIRFPGPSAQPPPWEPVETKFNLEDSRVWVAQNLSYVKGALGIVGLTYAEMVERVREESPFAKHVQAVLDEFERVGRHLIGLSDMMMIARERLAYAAGIDLEEDEPTAS